MVTTGNVNSFTVSINASPHVFHDMPRANLEMTAAIRIAVPAEPKLKLVHGFNRRAVRLKNLLIYKWDGRREGQCAPGCIQPGKPH